MYRNVGQRRSEEERNTIVPLSTVTSPNVPWKSKHFGFRRFTGIGNSFGNCRDLSFQSVDDTLINEDGEEVMLKCQQATITETDLMLKTRFSSTGEKWFSVQIALVKLQKDCNIAPFCLGMEKHTGLNY
jgi:hypothetical protein